MSNNNRHEIFEKSVPMLVIGIIFAISLGGLVEITPLFFQKQTNEPVEGLKPYTALQMEGLRAGPATSGKRRAQNCSPPILFP